MKASITRTISNANINQTGQSAPPFGDAPFDGQILNPHVEQFASFFFAGELVKIVQKNGAWWPSKHAQTIGNALAQHRHVVCGKQVFDLATGLGVLGILAKKLGARHVDASEYKQEFLDAAKFNANLNGVDFRDMFLEDWLNFSPKTLYDLMIANPPFFDVTDPNRRTYIDQTIRNAPRFLRTGGELLLIHSSMAGFAETEQQLDDAGFHFEIIASDRGLFREAYFSSEAGFIEYCRRHKGFDLVDDLPIEELRVYLCTLTALAKISHEPSGSAPVATSVEELMFVTA